MKPLTKKQRLYVSQEWGTELPFFQRRTGSGKGDPLFELSTARNRQLIDDGQQQRLANTTVAFFGLSVGSHAAETWAILSRARCIKLADPDTIAPTNLNRICVGWSKIGHAKTDVVTQLISDMLPHAKLFVLTKTDPRSMERFCLRAPRVSCIVDEIDDIEGKLVLRRIAHALSIPLISAVDVGDNVFLDVERYDQKPVPRYFLGRLPHVESIRFNVLSRAQKAKLVIQLVGLEHNSALMLSSLLSIGETIATWPQLGSTATVAGGLVATTIKRIILGEPVKSGRYVFDMDAFFSSGRISDDPQVRKLRRRISRQLGLP